MTALARPRVPTRRHLVFGAVALLGGILGGTTIRVDPTLASTATVIIPPTAAASLIAATSGEALAHNRADQCVAAFRPFRFGSARSPSGTALHDAGHLL